MAVSFTPNIGLAKPTESEIANEWTSNTKLSEDNNIIISSKMDIAFIQITPTFIAVTSNPSVGVGQIVLEYNKVQGFIFGTFVIVCLDPGVAPGTGASAYGVKLPELADVTFHTVGTTLADAPGVASCIGEGYMTDASAANNSGTVALDIVHIAGVAYARPITETFTGKSVRWLGPSLPFILATGDKLVGSFFYKAA